MVIFKLKGDIAIDETGYIYIRTLVRPWLTVVVQGRLGKVYAGAVGEAEREEEELRRALEKIYQIRSLRNEMRLAARQSGNKELFTQPTMLSVIK